MTKHLFFKRCPKSGRIVGIAPHIHLGNWIWPIVGFSALLWFCLRTFTKPSRLSYPCQQAAAPIAAGFLVWVGGFLTSAKLYRSSKVLWREHKLASVMALAGAVGILLGAGSLMGPPAFAQQDGFNTGSFTPKDAPNSPIGVARGIKPGRVSWIHDSAAVKYNEQGSYTEEKNFDQGRLDNLLRRVVISVPGTDNLHKAWDSLFSSNNRSRGRTAKGYTVGEKIAIKVNCNSSGSLTSVDQTPELVRSLLHQLVDTMRVAQNDILVYDAIRGDGLGTIKRFCQGEFPNVRYNDFSPKADWVDTIRFSNPNVPKSGSNQVPRWILDADYLINFALLKRHTTPKTGWSDPTGQAAVTVTGKNQCGSLRECAPLHPFFRDWYSGNGSYNAVVDLMCGPVLHDKTVLFLVDGLYSANRHDGVPLRWKMTPFNGQYPSSVFASQDQVAIESVALDFLNAEMGLAANADNYLHEAALIGNPPSKTKYVSRGKDTSMGVHEHWNNAVDKKYSRNLGTGQGIELYSVPLTGSLTASLSTRQVAESGIEFEPQQGGRILVSSRNILEDAEFFDARGRSLAKLSLSGNHAVVENNFPFRASFLRIRTESSSATRRL